MDKEGKNLRQLTDHPSDDQYPKWSPAGKQTAFVSSRDGGKKTQFIWWMLVAIIYVDLPTMLN